MKHFRVELTKTALESYSGLPRFERQHVWDLLEEFRIGNGLEGDYTETTFLGQTRMVSVVSKTAVTFLPDEEKKRVRITKIAPADRI